MSTSDFKIKVRAIGAALFLLCLFVSSVSKAVLFITPTRLVFEGRTRSATLTFLNQKPETTTYRLYWRDMRQNDEGKFERMKEGDSVPWSAQNMIRYSPRQVTLGPQESQVVRFALRKPKGLKEGEYRSHLVIEEQRSATEDNAESSPNDKGPISFKLELVYSYTIPILVEHGDLEPKAVIRDLSTRKIGGDEWELNAVIGNTGGASAIGVVRVEWEDDKGSRVLAEGGEQNVYLPQRERPLKLRFKKPDTPGRLRVAYYDDRFAKRRGKELASTKLLAEAYLK